MPEPLTLEAVGGAVITEGIKFLYGQAAEAVKRWRERRAAQKAETVPAAAPPFSAFEGPAESFEFHLEKVERLEKQLIQLRGALANYADGLETIDPGDHEVLEAVDALRQAMEAVYQRRLTFKGEQRASAGPVVEGSIDAGVIAGTASAVAARLIASGRIRGAIKADRVEGNAYGVNADIIDGRSDR